MLKDHIVNLNHNLMNVYTIPTVNLNHKLMDMSKNHIVDLNHELMNVFESHIANLNHNPIELLHDHTVIPTRDMVTLLVHMRMPHRKMKTPLKDMEITPEIMKNAQQLQKLNH